MNISLTYLLNNKESCNPFALSTSRSSSSSSCSTSAIPSSYTPSTTFSATTLTHQRSVSMPQIKTPYTAPLHPSKTKDTDISATSRLSDLASVIESSLQHTQDPSCSDNDDNPVDDMDVETREQTTDTRIAGLAARRGSSGVLKLPSISNLLNPAVGHVVKGGETADNASSASGQFTMQRYASVPDLFSSFLN